MTTQAHKGYEDKRRSLWLAGDADAVRMITLGATVLTTLAALGVTLLAPGKGGGRRAE